MTVEQQQDGSAGDAGVTEEEQEEESIRVCRSLLHKKIRVSLNDGRFVIGSFQCIDSRGNMIVGNALEIRKRATYDGDESVEDSMMMDIDVGGGGTATARPAAGQWMERYVGLVIIGKHQRQSVKVKATRDEIESLLKMKNVTEAREHSISASLSRASIL